MRHLGIFMLRGPAAARGKRIAFRREPTPIVASFGAAALSLLLSAAILAAFVFATSALV